MRPYVSGKLDKLLQSRETNSYKDLYPTPNTNWYYAVTVVNGNGQEGKIVDAKKVRLKKFFSLCMTFLSLKNSVHVTPSGHTVASIWIGRGGRKARSVNEKSAKGDGKKQSERERESPLLPPSHHPSRSP